MTLTVEAVYENGVLKPIQPLPLKEHERVQVTIQPTTSRARLTAGETVSLRSQPRAQLWWGGA